MGNVPEGQYNRAVGVGWIPQLDVPEDEVPPNKARDACMARFAKYGQEPANGNNAAIMAGACEQLDFINAAVEAGGPDITVDSFIRGAESLGDTFPAYQGLGNANFGPGRHAGAAFYRLLKYDPGCHCFHYASKPIRDR